MMKTVQRVLLIAVALALVSGSAPGEKTQKKEVPPKGKPNVLDLLGVRDATKAAADMRKAGESFERFGNSMETTTPILSKALTESTRNLADIGGAFDPIGLKTAFAVIREQGQTIQALQQAEIDRLKAECERLRKELDQRQGGAKKRNEGSK
jgi:hypothetical protein